MKNALAIEGLSKSYQLTTSLRSANTQEKLFSAIKAPFKKLLNGKGESREEIFWALRDVSFEVREGEVLGIVGRNGAGKSTLLKVLSKIVEPTFGTIKVRGRLASLLEVGTGFHPELSGRENIYLNGSILGMRKVDIDRKFDSIVDFAEVEKFLDTPVKRYSSGMYVRLAFAVSAHLDPNILIVDEVLAVGDAEFQRKCLGKLNDVARSGDRTVVFVSHNMAAVRSLCTSGIYLRNGAIEATGSITEVLNSYLSFNKPIEYRPTVSRFGITMVSFEFRGAVDGAAVVEFGSKCSMRGTFSCAEIFHGACLVVRIFDEEGVLVSSMCSTEEGMDAFQIGARVTIEFKIESMRLMPGKYSVSAHIFRSNDHVEYLEADGCAKFEVLPGIVNGAGWAYERHHGVMRVADSVSCLVD